MPTISGLLLLSTLSLVYVVHRLPYQEWAVGAVFRPSGACCRLLFVVPQLPPALYPGCHAIPCRGWAVFLVHGGYLIEDGQKQDREWNTNYLDLQFVIHMSDFYDQLADGR